jgi:hypothetical protein
LADNKDDKPDDKTTSIVPAHNATLSPRKAKRQFIKERELAAFATLYNNNGTPEQICSALHIARRTYYRYLKAYSDQQRERLQEHGDDELFATIGKVDHSFNYAASRCVQIIENKGGKYTEDAEVAALHLLCEIQAAQLTLRTDGPIKTMRELPASIKRRITTFNKETGEQTEEIEIEIEDGDRKEDSTIT